MNQAKCHCFLEECWHIRLKFMVNSAFPVSPVYHILQRWTDDSVATVLLHFNVVRNLKQKQKPEHNVQNTPEKTVISVDNTDMIAKYTTKLKPTPQWAFSNVQTYMDINLSFCDNTLILLQNIVVFTKNARVTHTIMESCLEGSWLCKFTIMKS